MDRIRHLHGDEMTWQTFITEFQKEYISKSCRKGKQDAFFRLAQEDMTVREYIDKFEDLYWFVADIYRQRGSAHPQMFGNYDTVQAQGLLGVQL